MTSYTTLSPGCTGHLTPLSQMFIGVTGKGSTILPITPCSMLWASGIIVAVIKRYMWTAMCGSKGGGTGGPEPPP